MLMKPTNAYKRLRLRYVIYIKCTLHVSGTLMAILRNVQYKGYIIKAFLTNAQM
jgi:hypothetical protein